jgi:hypothetical protein
MKRIAALAAVVLIGQAACAGDDDSDVFQTLCKLSFMGQRAAAELSMISTNQATTEDVRAAAKTALRHHDTSGTNSYHTLAAFIRGWTVTNEPPLNIETIGLMKQSMDLGHSATKQLEAFAADTNRPAPFRDAASNFLKALEENEQKAPNKPSEATP